MSTSPPTGASCPLCGLLLEGECNRDHVFGSAFGSRATVWTHKACNSLLSKDVEAVLHGRNSFFNLVRAVHGVAKLPLVGTDADGHTVHADLAKGDAHPAKPQVRVADSHGTLNIEVFGSPQQQRKIFKDLRRRYGVVVPAYQDLPPDVKKATAPSSPMVSIALSLRLDLAERFSIKAALGAGVHCFGPGFATSPLAAALRARAAAPYVGPSAETARAKQDTQWVRSEVLTLTFELLSKFMAEVAPSGPPLTRLEPLRREFQVCFLPLAGKASTAVLVHVLGYPVLPYGLVVPARLPERDFGQAEAPVVLREDETSREVIDFQELLLTPVIEHAKLARTLEDE